MTTLFVIGVACAALAGLFIGIVLGAGLVVQRIRSYRDIPRADVDEFHIRVIIGDLLTYLNQ